MHANRIDERDDNLPVFVRRGQRSPAFGQWWDDCSRLRRAYLAVRLDGEQSSVELDLLPAGRVLSATGQVEVAAAMTASDASEQSFGFGDTVRTARAWGLSEQAVDTLRERLLEIVATHAMDEFERGQGEEWTRPIT